MYMWYVIYRYWFTFMLSLIADIYISISTETFDIENIKYEERWQQLDLDPHFEP